MTLNTSSEKTPSDRIEQKYKTEKCNKLPNCPYGHNCKFAHNNSELKPFEKCKNYRVQKCESFFLEGYCSYGNRCNFMHYETKTDYSLKDAICKDVLNDYDYLYGEFKKERKRLRVFTRICTN